MFEVIILLFIFTVIIKNVVGWPNWVSNSIFWLIVIVSVITYYRTDSFWEAIISGFGVALWSFIIVCPIMFIYHEELERKEKNPEKERKSLINAAKNGHTKVVKSLLKKGANVNAKDYQQNNETALIWAACKGHEDIVELLLTNDADVNAKDEDGITALMEAADKGHEDIVELLLANGADVNAKDKYDWTALMIAANKGHKEVVKLLLAEGADVNAKNNNGSTALMKAANKGHKEVVKLLLAKGADVNARDGYGKTALTYALEQGHTGIVKMLQNKMNTALMKTNRNNPNANKAKSLLNESVNVNAKDKDGKTALNEAAEGDYEEAVRLLNYGGD